MQRQEDTQLEKPIIVLVCGRSGSGKTTATEKIVFYLRRRFLPEEIEIQTFSIGDVYRAIIRSRGDNPEERSLLYEESKKNMHEVESYDFPLWLKDNVPNIKWDKKGIVVIDGIRTPEEAEGMRELYPDLIVVFCDCPEDEIVKRLQVRGTSQETIIYSLAQPLEVDYSSYYLKQEGVIVASPAEEVGVTAKKVVARVEAAMAA